MMTNPDPNAVCDFLCEADDVSRGFSVCVQAVDAFAQ
jgi:hypothetical protein